MALNTHYSGRLLKAIKRTLDKASGREGKFYEIFNAHGFYDIDDTNNGLTPEQRAQVPKHNQRKFTQFSNALVEMFRYVLADDEGGVLTQSTQEILDKLDIRSSANNAQLNAIGAGFKAVAANPLYSVFGGIDATRTVVDAQTTSVMGSSPFNVDMIPPITIGLDGLPVSIANVFKSGFFQPNWDFLYKQELVKSDKFYDIGDGKLRIGCNILLDQGGSKRDVILKNIFSVTSTDTNLNPIGDLKGGITAEEFDIIKTAASVGSSALSSDSSIYNFRLSESQIQASFFKYVQIRLWGAISNRRNWAHGHWGALTHNSCPEYVKTAVCSCLWTNGLAIESGKSDISAFISYCVTMGVYYLTGYTYPIKMYGIAGIDSILTDSNTRSDITENAEVIAQYGVPKDKKIANYYFTWVADILARVTSDSNGTEIGKAIRKRRIAEANLIYSGLGQPTISYGTDISKLDYFHTEAGLRERGFGALMSASIYRYKNEGAAGGSMADGSLSQPEDSSTVVEYASTANADAISDISKSVIKYLCAQAGLSYALVTSTYRPPEAQARAMFNNLQANKTRNLYGSKSPAPTGSRGRAVVNRYYSKKLELGFNESQPVTGESNIAAVKQAMIDEINRQGPETISKHSCDFNIVQAIDISPNTMRPSNRKTAFETACNDAVKSGILRRFIPPPRDPAYHFEIWQPASSNGQPFSVGQPNTALPDQKFTMSIPNYAKSNAWLVPLSRDRIYAVSELSDESDQS